MLKRIFGLSVISGVAVLLSACTNMTRYEQQVEDWEPVYCYKSIGAVQCYKEPKHSDSRRLVNFYGPPPSSYDAPDAPDYAAAKPPKMIDYWVKDAEPIPQASPAPVSLKEPPAKMTDVEAPETTGNTPQNEDVSFMDGLMRSMFGKPQLANKPVATANAPQQPAPPAQPRIPVETGSL